MGNRAIVIFKQQESELSPQVYLHWNGGPESIGAFLAEMKRRDWTRSDYAAARFCQVVGEYFTQMGESFSSDGLSLGCWSNKRTMTKTELEHLAGGQDNGIYVVEIHTGKFCVTQYQERKAMRFFTTGAMDDILKEEGSAYVAGKQHLPKEKFEGILDFFIRREAHLKAYVEPKQESEAA